jgi:hypothetical protein
MFLQTQVRGTSSVLSCLRLRQWWYVLVRVRQAKGMFDLNGWMDDGYLK